MAVGRFFALLNLATIAVGVVYIVSLADTVNRAGVLLLGIILGYGITHELYDRLIIRPAIDGWKRCLEAWQGCEQELRALSGEVRERDKLIP